MIATTVLDSIGNTPIVELHKVVPPNSARVTREIRMGESNRKHERSDGESCD